MTHPIQTALDTVFDRTAEALRWQRKWDPDVPYNADLISRLMDLDEQASPAPWKATTGHTKCTTGWCCSVQGTTKT